MTSLKIALLLLISFNFAHTIAEETTTEKNLTEPHKRLKWQPFNITKENDDIVQERKELERKLIDDVAVRGDAVKEYRIGLRQMNLFMRQHHAEMRVRVGHNLYPLILVLDTDHDKKLSGVGSEYILYLQNGTVMTMKPTPIEYETNKNLAHIALGIFSIISPFFKNPTSTKWQPALKEYYYIIQSNIEALEASGLNNTFPPLCEENVSIEDQKLMMSMASDYIESCFQKKSVNVDSYKNFTRHYRPYMQKALKCAAQMQVKSGLAGVERWKELLGPKLWRDLYVVIPVIWPVARVNPRQLIFEKLMDPDRKITHIIKAEGITTIAEARELLGRVVADRSLAHFVFGSSKEISDTDSNLSLSTRRDIAASYGNMTLEDYFKQDEDIFRSVSTYFAEVTANELRYDESGPPS